MLFDSGIDPEVAQETQRNPIFFAMKFNDSKLLAEILSWNDIEIDWSSEDEQGRNIFHVIS